MINFIVAQSLGILGMTANVVSYQAKSRAGVIFFQIFGSVFFAVNMFMLDAKTGFCLNLIGILRGLFYSHKDKFKNITAITSAFIILYILSYVSVFTVFGKEPCPGNFVLETLPVIAMTATTVGFSKNDAKSIRIATFVSSPLWLIYNCLNLSIGGILCETLSIVSVLSAFIRLDLRRVTR